MLLVGCLLAFSAALAPRLVLILAWIFSARWPLVWQGNWFLPLLGIIFLPYTTVMYLLAYTVPVGVAGFDWFWILMGVLLDVWKWTAVAQNRRQVPGYPQEDY